MADFTLIGERHQRLVRVTWADGALSGDPATVALVHALAQAYDGQPVAASFAPSTTTAAAHLASPTSAYTLMELCFLDTRPELEGTVPGLGYDDVGTWDGPPLAPGMPPSTPDDGTSPSAPPQPLTEPLAEDGVALNYPDRGNHGYWHSNSGGGEAAGEAAGGAHAAGGGAGEHVTAGHAAAHGSTDLTSRHVDVTYTSPTPRTYLHQLFGRDLADGEVASLVGAQHGDRVTVSARDRGQVVLELYSGRGNPAYEAQRTVQHDRAGRLVIYNEYVRVEDTGHGTGTRLFADQVRGAAALGVERIKTVAARTADMNGYSTWPKLGYNGAIPAHVAAALPAHLAGARSVRDLMRTPEGRAWWTEHGATTNMEFDLAAGSRSQQDLAAYLQVKGMA